MTSIEISKKQFLDCDGSILFLLKGKSLNLLDGMLLVHSIIKIYGFKNFLIDQYGKNGGQ